MNHEIIMTVGGFENPVCQIGIFPKIGINNLKKKTLQPPPKPDCLGFVLKSCSGFQKNPCKSKSAFVSPKRAGFWVISDNLYI